MPFVVLAALAGSFAALGSIASTSTSLVRLCGRLYTAGWGLFALVYGLYVAPHVFVDLANDLSAYKDGSDIPAGSSPAANANMNSFRVKLKALAGVAFFGGGGMTPVLLAFAFAPEFMAVVSYFMPVSMSIDAQIMMTATWVMMNAAKNTNHEGNAGGLGNDGREGGAAVKSNDSARSPRLNQAISPHAAGVGGGRGGTVSSFTSASRGDSARLS